MAKRQQVPRETIDQGTKQTRERLRADPIDELAAAWKRSHEPGAAEMENAAREIRRCYQMVSRAVMARIGNLDGTPAGSSASPAADRLVIAYNDRYKPWADAMGKIGILPIVIDWLHEEHTFEQIDRDRRTRNGTASTLIRQALWQYCIIAGWVGRRETVDVRGAGR
jgi:hypothetical protein